MAKKIGVTIIGGTGYGAGELLRLLVRHPEAEVVFGCIQVKSRQPCLSAASSP